LSAVCFTDELQRNPTRLTSTHESVVTPGSPQPLDELVVIGVLLCELVLEREGVFHRLVLCRLSRVGLMFLVLGAVVDYALELASVVPRVRRSAPDTRYAELAAATLIIVVGAVNLAPRMRAADLYMPAIAFGMP